MERPLRIGELGERHGLSTATLRYYERRGLLGRPQRSQSGYRMFTADDEARLRFILRGKALDLSLEEIGSLLEAWHQGQCGETRTRLRHLVAHKITEARRQAREAEAFADQLAHVYARLGEQAPAGGECACIPDLPASGPPTLVAELDRIAQSVCSCGGRLDSSSDCACGCCDQPARPARGGDEMPEETTSDPGAVATATTCDCCAPARSETSGDGAPGACNCGTDASSGGCGPDCSCGAGN